MLKKIKELSIALVSAILFAVPVLSPVIVHADNISDRVCAGVNTATGVDDDPATPDDSCADATNGDTAIGGVITDIINVFSLIIGAVAVIMIIYGGFKYITSGGNDSNVGSAKNTILYAVIGLVVVALAQIIVRYVLAKASV